MKKVLFRASSAGALMTDPKTIKDREAGILSQTAKSMVRKKWLYDNYGYKEDLSTPAILKGGLCEQDSMELVQAVKGGEFRTRYGINLTNDFISGTPDIVLKNVVEDIKTNENLETFFEVEAPTSMYIAQAQCYMELTNLDNFFLHYALVRTPDEIMNNLTYRKDYDQLCRNNEIINTIAPELRVKSFEIKRDKEFIEKLYQRVEQAREYYNTITL